MLGLGLQDVPGMGSATWWQKRSSPVLLGMGMMRLSSQAACCWCSCTALVRASCPARSSRCISTQHEDRPPGNLLQLGSWTHTAGTGSHMHRVGAQLHCQHWRPRCVEARGGPDQRSNTAHPEPFPQLGQGRTKGAELAQDLAVADVCRAQGRPVRGPHMQQQQLGRQRSRPGGCMLHVPRGGLGQGLQHLARPVWLQLGGLPAPGGAPQMLWPPAVDRACCDELGAGLRVHGHGPDVCCVLPRPAQVEGCCLHKVGGEQHLRWPKSSRSSAGMPRQLSTTVWTDAASAAASCLL